MQFHFHANQSHNFHKNGFALRLALKQRHKGTRKWPIAIACFHDLRQNNCKFLLQADFFECLPIFCSYVVCYKTPKNCLSLAYATDLNCYCYYSLVLYCTSIGGTRSQCNKYYTHADVKAHHTIFVKLWKQLILQSFSILTFVTKCSVAIKQNQLRVQKMHRNNTSFNQGTLIF